MTEKPSYHVLGNPTPVIPKYQEPKLTVGALRRAIEGVADDMEIVVIHDGDRFHPDVCEARVDGRFPDEEKVLASEETRFFIGLEYAHAMPPEPERELRSDLLSSAHPELSERLFAAIDKSVERWECRDVGADRINLSTYPAIDPSERKRLVAMAAAENVELVIAALAKPLDDRA